MNIEKLINKVTTDTVIKLKKSNLLKDNSKTAFERTEEILKNYKKYKQAIENDPKGTSKTKKLINNIEKALKTIETDPYYSIIEMIYFENKTRQEVSDFYDVEIKTITRNKNRLINKLKYIICSDQTIEEVFDL